MTDPTTTPAALPDELQRLLNAASALVQRSAHIGGHVVTEPSDHAALREALAPARAAAEGLAREAEQNEAAMERMIEEAIAAETDLDHERLRVQTRDLVIEEVREERDAARRERDAARHESAQQAQAAELWRNSHTAASLTVVQQAEELARLRADLADAQERADRLAAERREGIGREASLALVVERLMAGLGRIAREGGTTANGAECAQMAAAARFDILTTTTAPDAAPAALLQAARAVLAEVAAREGLKQALRHDAPAGALREAAETHGQAEIALEHAAKALRAAGLVGEEE